MKEYTEKDTFEFGNEEQNSMITNNEPNYEDAYLFNTEVLSDDKIKYNNENEIYSSDEEEQFNFKVFDTGFGTDNIDNNESVKNDKQDSLFITLDSKEIVEETKKDILSSEIIKNNDQEQQETKFELEKTPADSSNVKESLEELTAEVDSLEDKDNFFDKKTEEISDEINSSNKKISMSHEDLASLTTFEEDKVEKTDIKSLFDRVGINVKEASDVFKRNSEMKEKLDSRFEELKKLQLEVARKKDEQYAEINAYKEEVLNKLTEKKEEIEKRLNKLKNFQASLEKEKEEFEQYRKKEKEEIERVQKEVQDAYDSRREELNHIEDVLRRQKDMLDEERNQLSLDKIQYESDKNELANNLLKFNEIVDSFTNGIDKLDKE